MRASTSSSFYQISCGPSSSLIRKLIRPAARYLSSILPYWSLNVFSQLTADVGYFSDPEEFPGLAHFLEHMLFMGTEKYPEEAEYSKFINEHGGSNNAYTDTNLTNYQVT